jgi:hypothetical protein
MRIFKNKWFARFARKNRIDDEALKSAVSEIEAGNFDADLGGSVFKQHVARPGGGKRGGYRTILFFKCEERAFFVYGFAKNERDDINEKEECGFKATAKDLLGYTDEQIQARLDAGSLIEILSIEILSIEILPEERNGMEKKFKYESEALGVIHEEALESFRIGAISEARMREYDAMCLVQPPTATVLRVASQKPSGTSERSGASVYARGK